MINANELRIGNWVSNGQIQYTVDANVIYDVANFENYIIQPIPLTPDILDSVGLLGDDGPLEFDLMDVDRKSVCEWKVLQKGNVLCTIYYVHQLQNLYFALCGEELEVKF